MLGNKIKSNEIIRYQWMEFRVPQPYKPLEIIKFTSFYFLEDYVQKPNWKYRN